MVFEKFIRYPALAVGLKPSARQGEVRLRGLYRIMYSKTITGRVSDAAVPGRKERPTMEGNIVFVLILIFILAVALQARTPPPPPQIIVTQSESPAGGLGALLLWFLFVLLILALVGRFVGA
jgi:hypothetical protein